MGLECAVASESRRELWFFGKDPLPPDLLLTPPAELPRTLLEAWLAGFTEQDDETLTAVQEEAAQFAAWRGLAPDASLVNDADDSLQDRLRRGFAVVSPRMP